MKLLLVGGYPKGYDIPFHPETLSGKRLRRLVDKYNLDVEYLDIFQNEMAEKFGLIEENAYYKLIEYANDGLPIIALGNLVYDCVFEVGVNPTYLPHPAARRGQDLKELERGLAVYG